MNNYTEFVKQTTSAPSLDYAVMATRFAELEANGTNTTQLLTAALGLTAEAGEFTEVVKKIVFQGNPTIEDNVFHMKRDWVTSVGILLKHSWHWILILKRFLI